MYSRKSSVVFLFGGPQSSDREGGQTLMELIVVVAVSVIVVGALVFATIASLRNASFSKNQAQATKLAQEGIERVRVGRDRDRSLIILGVPSNTVSSWNGSSSSICPGTTDIKSNSVWCYRISGSGLCDDTANSPPGKCYFNVNPMGSLDGIGFGWNQSSLPSQAEVPSGAPVFKRVVTLSDDSTTFGNQKTVTAIVTWTDFSGTHESRLTTILRRI